MQRESQAPSIERPHPFEHRRNLSDRGFSTCPSGCEQATQLDWGDFWGDHGGRHACIRKTLLTVVSAETHVSTALYACGHFRT